MPVQTVIKLRRDTAANWLSTNPVLAAGEAGLETDTNLVKYGNGTSAWDALAYASSSRTTQIAKNNTGGSVTRGQVVYISGANGANALFLLADADSEATSSKTVGLLAQDLATNGIGAIVTEGLLSNVNTGAASAGDSVWLSGTAGGFVFGAPPAKPAHSVYLGVVTRASITVGEILVKVQNGYELNELHDVNAGSPADNNVLAWDSASSLWINQTVAGIGAAAASHTHAQSDVTDLTTDLAAKAPLASPTFTGTVTAAALTVTGTTKVKPIIETVTQPNINFAGYTFDALTSAIATINDGSANGVVNIRGNASTTLNSMLAVGESITVTLIIPQLMTGYYVTGVQIDGGSTQLRWLGGTAPTSGNINAHDVYTFTVMKLGVSFFRTYASVSKFA